jgi:hypothetical protein
VLTGPSAAMVTSIDDRLIFLDVPTPLVREHGQDGPRWVMRSGGVQSAHGTGDRLAAASLWASATFAWRDQTGLLRDRQSVIILPREFQVTICPAGDGRGGQRRCCSCRNDPVTSDHAPGGTCGR